MGWIRSIITAFLSGDESEFEQTGASYKVDDDGYVSDFIHHTENDSSGGHHGHVWGLNSNNDNDIGGRSEK